MFMVYLLFVLLLFFLRMMAGYDSRYQKGKYITVKNTFWSKVLMGDISLIYGGTKRLQEDRNKMSVFGVVFYAAAGFVLLVNLFFWLVNDIPIELWEIEAEVFFVYADTLNEKVSALVILILFTSFAIYFDCEWFFYTADTIKDKMPKWLKIFVRVVWAIILLSVVALSIYFIFELVFCFL